MKTEIHTIRRRQPSAGFTIVELLVASVVATILMGAVYQVLVTNQRVSVVQREQLTGHQTVRAGIDLLTQELREVSAGGGDLLTIESQRVAFRALRAQGVACVVGTESNPTLRVATLTRPFTEGENLYVFADNDPERTDDDSWLATSVQSVQNGETCGTDGVPAQAIRITGLGAPAFSRIRQGAQVRSWEEVEYTVRLFSGESYLVRVLNGTAAQLVGPLAANAGLAFEYLDIDGNVTATAAQVARVRVQLKTASDVRTEGGRQVLDSLVTTVHLRN